MGAVLIWPVIKIVVNVVFKKILTLMTVMHIVSRNRAISHTKMQQLVT